MKQRVFYTLLFLQFFAFAILTQGQTDFIVTNAGDTLFGEVFQPLNLLKNVQFKPGGGKDFQTYTSNEIREYRFGEDNYSACAITPETEMIFLISLVKGAANLYLKPTKSTFYMEKNGVFHVLEKNNRIIDGKELEDRRFAGILKALFNDCSLPEKRFEQLKFTDRYLSEITQEYNACRNPQQNYTKRKFALKVDMIISTGVAFNKTALIADLPFLLKNDGFSAGYLAGIDAILSASVASRLHFRPGIMLTKKYGGYQEQFTLDNIFTEVRLSYLQFPLRLGYMFPGKKISFLLSAGYLYSYAVEKELTSKKVGILNGKVEYNVTSKLYDPSENGFIAGVGIQSSLFKKIHPIFEYQFDRTKVAYNDGYDLTTHKIVLGIKW